MRPQRVFGLPLETELVFNAHGKMQDWNKASDLCQMDSNDLSANVPNPDTLPAQYSYDSFDEVLDWIAHFSTVFVDKCAPILFASHLRLRDHYLSQGNAKGVESIENLIKNDIGICRFEEETENFRQKFIGKCAKFWQGKFLGWEGEVSYDPSLKGVMGYRLI